MGLLVLAAATARSVVDVALLCDVGTANREECDAARAAVDAARKARDGALDGHRRDMKAYARERFLWKHVAKRWEDHFLGKVV